MRLRITMLSLLLIVPLGLLASGFSSAAAVQDTGGDHVLRIEWNNYPDTLDPQRISDTFQSAILGLGFEGLTRINEELNVAPGAAESWEFSRDGLMLTFHLRNELVYSDGTPLTAERFRYAIERLCDPAVDSPYADVAFAIAGCEAFHSSRDNVDSTPAAGQLAYAAARAALGVRAPDDRTLQITLREPAVYLPAALSMADFFPAKQELIEAGGEDWWRNPANLVGNGPFVIETIGNTVDVPSKMVFTANERYWDGRPKLDRIEYVMANEDRTSDLRLDAFKRDDVDITYLDDSTQVSAEADPDLARDVVVTTLANTSGLAFNMNRAPFTDKKVREAFAYGFDRGAHCRQIEYSFCTPTVTWIPVGVPGHIDTDAYAFDPAKARQALAASSYGGPEKLPEIPFYYSSEDDKRDAEWIAAQYKAVLGVALKLVHVDPDEWDALYDSPETAPPFTGIGWVQDYPDPENWLSIFWTCGAFSNRGHYCDPEFDALVKQADAELDPDKRLALYEQAGQLLLNDVPAIFLRNFRQAQLVKPFVTGYVPTPMDVWPGMMTPLTIDVDRP